MACLVHKIDNLKLHQYFYDKLIKGSDIHDRVTRHRELYTVSRHSSAMFQCTFSYNVANIINSVPDDIKAASNFFVYRTRTFTFNTRDLMYIHVFKY